MQQSISYADANQVALGVLLQLHVKTVSVCAKACYDIEQKVTDLPLSSLLCTALRRVSPEMEAACVQPCSEAIL